MTVFLGSLVLTKPTIPTVEPPPAASDVFVIGGQGGDILGGQAGDEIGQERP